jgi:small GTP-binding protein
MIISKKITTNGPECYCLYIYLRLNNDMGFFQKLISKLKTTNYDVKISVLGSTKAGKTTLVRYIETGLPQEDTPLSTLGVDYRNKPVKINNWSLNMIDVGGQKVYQNAFWDFVVEQSEGVVYVIDATVKPETDEATFIQQYGQFTYASEIINDDTVMLILLNKQDLVEMNPITPETFGQYYPLTNLINKSFTIMPVSAKYGQGVDDSLQWFVQTIAQKL